MIKISLITPTRGRPDDLNRLLQSVSRTTIDFGQVEILLAVDKDDTFDYKKLISEYWLLTITIYYVTRSDHFSKDYYNFLSLKAQGRWIMCINDDSLFVTPGWDKIIDNKMSAAANTVKDDILLGIVNDGMKREGNEKLYPVMSCWVLSSKEYVNLMHGILLEEIYTWGGDYWIGRLFCKVQYGQRKVYIPEVFIDHNSHHLKDMPQPETFKHFQRIEQENPCTFNESKVATRAKFINEYIRSKH